LIVSFATLILIGCTPTVNPPTTQPVSTVLRIEVKDAVTLYIVAAPTPALRTQRAQAVLAFAMQVQSAVATSSLNVQQLIQLAIQGQPNAETQMLAEAVVSIFEDQIQLATGIDLTAVNVSLPQLAQARDLLASACTGAIDAANTTLIATTKHGA
jgi:hypothetical protein